PVSVPNGDDALVQVDPAEHEILFTHAEDTDDVARGDGQLLGSDQHRQVGQLRAAHIDGVLAGGRVPRDDLPRPEHDVRAALRQLRKDRRQVAIGRHALASSIRCTKVTSLVCAVSGADATSGTVTFSIVCTYVWSGRRTSTGSSGSRGGFGIAVKSGEYGRPMLSCSSFRAAVRACVRVVVSGDERSEEHTSELQSR